jgi:hypothetical protein
VMQEVLEDMVLGGREIDEDAAAANGLLKRVEFDVARVEGGMCRALPASDERFGAGDEFAEIERLGEIIVCAGVEEFNDDLLPFLCSEDENGGWILAGAHASEEALAVEPGEHEVKDDKVVAEIACGIIAGFAIRSPVDGETGGIAQGGSKIFGQPDLVLNQQHTHGGVLHVELWTRLD